MAETGKIYITITNEKSNGNGNTTNNDKTSKENDKNNVLAHYINDFIISKSKQCVNYAINNIGNFTGNYTVQKEISSAINIGGTLMGIGLATAKYGIVGFGIATASVLINTGYQELNSSIAINKQNKEIQQLREISGLNSLTNGSR